MILERMSDVELWQSAGMLFVEAWEKSFVGLHRKEFAIV